MNVLRVDYKSDAAAKDFARSLQNTGFAVLVNHSIDPKLIFDVYQEWEVFFFSQNKMDYKFDETVTTQHGYFPFRSENAKDYPVKDLKEFYHYYPQFDLPSSLSSKTGQLFNALTDLASDLLEKLESETPEEIRNIFSEPLANMSKNSDRTLLRILHYPPLEGDFEEGAIRARAHEDIDLLTLLPAATAPGLQVKDLNDEWHEVVCNPGEIVINAGDMLQMASNGYYKSTTHQVVNPQGDLAKTSRFSMPLFLHPRGEVRLSDEHTAHSYRKERLEALGIATKDAA